MSDKFAVSFQKDGDGKMASMTMHQPGASLVLPKDKPAKVEPMK
jgi:hypothetical protein